MFLFWMGYLIHMLISSSVHQFIHIFLQVAYLYEDFVHEITKKQIGFLCVRQICRCAKVGKVGNRICAKLFSGSVQCRRRRRGPIIWYSCLSLPRYSPKGKYTHRHSKHTHTHTLRHTSEHTHTHVHVPVYTITHKSTNTHTDSSQVMPKFSLPEKWIFRFSGFPEWDFSRSGAQRRGDSFIVNPFEISTFEFYFNANSSNLLVATKIAYV